MAKIAKVLSANHIIITEIMENSLISCT